MTGIDSAQITNTGEKVETTEMIQENHVEFCVGRDG